VISRPALGFAGNVIVLMYLFLVGTFFLALAGLDAGSAFGGMGGSREVAVAALAEPTIVLAVFALAMRAGTINLGGVVERVSADPRTSAGLRRVLHRDARGDRPFASRQPGHPSGADDDSRGHGPRILGARPRHRRVGRRDEALPLHVPARESLLPVGRADGRGRHDPGRRCDRSGGQAHRAGRAPGGDGDGRGQASPVPRARAPGGVVRARPPLGHVDVPAAMTAAPITTATNFLAFLGLV